MDFESDQPTAPPEPVGEVPDGTVRWAFNFAAWSPTEEEWQAALKLVSPEERERIGKFKRGPLKVGRNNPDAKSSLIGRLMIRKLVSEQLQMDPAYIKLGRTEKGKPYLMNPPKADTFPNFNFNVSHAGDYVVLGSEPYYIIGVDVMEVALTGRKPLSLDTLENFFKSFTDTLNPPEWRAIRAASTSYGKLENFYTFWTLKEAYIKAVGIGLGFPLAKATFSLEEVAKKDPIDSFDLDRELAEAKGEVPRQPVAPTELEGAPLSPSAKAKNGAKSGAWVVPLLPNKWRRARLALAGKATEGEWTFRVGPIGSDHIAAVGLGQPAHACQSYGETLPIAKKAYSSVRSVPHEMPEPPFRILSASELLRDILAQSEAGAPHTPAKPTTAPSPPPPSGVPAAEAPAQATEQT